MEPLSQIVSWMGGNVIATANAAYSPNQINNEEWLESIPEEICQRINIDSQVRSQSNLFLERSFVSIKASMLQQEEAIKGTEIMAGELDYWKKTGMLNFDTVENYLATKHRNLEIVL